MKKIIHHIRKQPEEVKTRILHILVFFAGVLLVFLWIYSLGTTLTDAETQNKINQDLKPLSALKDNLVEGYNSMTTRQ